MVKPQNGQTSTQEYRKDLSWGRLHFPYTTTMPTLSLYLILNKFADDTKIGNEITSQQDHINLQQCPDDLCSWADKWGMRFNEKKCKVVHFGKKNPGKNYSMNGLNLAVSEIERDLGVNMHVSLKPSMHCKEAERKANATVTHLSGSIKPL